MIGQFIAVGIGGAIGSMARFGIGRISMAYWPNLAFPLATLLINWLGCFLMGVLMLGLQHAQLPVRWQPFIGVGILGGFTTFSAFSLEATLLWQRGEPGLAAAYVGLSVVGGIAALIAGMALARTIL